MTEMNLVLETDLENTSTLALAQELFRGSWKWNVGRKVEDIPIFDALSDIAKFHLLDVAAAAETMLERYDTEDYKLVLYNLAVVIYQAYHSHPASSVPDLPYDTAPEDVQRLWIEYARAMLDLWYLIKTQPRHKGWLDIKVKPE